MKVKLNYFIDSLLAVSFFVVAATGLIIFFFLPEGVRRGGCQEFLGIIKQNYINIHNWSGILFIILVAVHLVLHWQWIACITRSLLKKNEVSFEGDKGEIKK